MARTPRVLSPSAGLAKALRACRAVADLALGSSEESWQNLREELGATLRLRHGSAIDLDELERFEREIGFQLPDDVLIIAAGGESIAQHLTGLRGLDAIAAAAEDDPAPPAEHGWIALTYSRPLGELWEGDHGGSHHRLAIQRSAGLQGEPRIHVATDDREDDELSGPLGELILEKLRTELEGKDWDLARRASEDPAIVLGDGPRLVRRERALVPERIVEHPKFGRGTVVLAIGKGAGAKLTIRFDDGQERTLLARSVKDRPR